MTKWLNNLDSCSQKSNVIFDLDDTLFDTQFMYGQLIDKLHESILKYVVNKNVYQNKNVLPYFITSQIFMKWNKHFIEKDGLGHNSLIKAIKKTVLEIFYIFYEKETKNNNFNYFYNNIIRIEGNKFINRKEKIFEILDINTLIFNEILDILNNIHYYNFKKEFKQLSEKYNLFVFTVGEKLQQYDKLKKCGILPFLKKYFIKKSKTINDWKEIYKEIPLTDIYVIGDSITNDILPNLSCSSVKEIFFIEPYCPFNDKIDFIEINIIKKYKSNFLLKDKYKLGVYKAMQDLLNRGENV